MSARPVKSDRHLALLPKSEATPVRIAHPRVDRACNGNCNQGRACDCVPDIDEPEQLPTPGFRAVLVLLAIAVGATLAIVALTR